MGDEEEEASLGATRYPVMPSLVALQQMRNRLHLAYLGKKLMKWTALATGKELRRLSMEMGLIMTDYGLKTREAFMLLARARFFVPAMNVTVLESVPNQACVTVVSTNRSVSGVKVKNMNILEMGCDSYKFVGMSKGGVAIKECKEAWLDLLRLMVTLCQYRLTFQLIDIANKNATKKQNVLSRCIIPRIIITMRYILSELDEMEREESFRLKRFKQLKYKHKVQETVQPILEEPPKPVSFRVPEPKPEPKPKPKPEPVREPEPEPVREPEPMPEPKFEPKLLPIPEPKLDPLQLLITHINEVVRLAEQLENGPGSPSDIGLTICDLRRLKVQLQKLIELSQEPIANRICSKCMKIEHQKTPKPEKTKMFVTPKPDGVDTAINLVPPLSTSISETCDPLDLQAMSKNRIEQLEKHVDEVICTTNHYQCEGLLSKSVEDFLKCCKSVKIKIQESKCQKIVRAKLDRLKEQVTNLEKITDIVQKKDLSATTVKSFMSCCKEFRAKLDHIKAYKGPPSICSIEKLLNRIDYSIVLSKEAKAKGLVSESLEGFIKSCVDIKSKIEPHNEPKPQVIGDLILNLNDIINFIKKYKDGALISESIETFYKHCKTTKAKLDSYKARPTPGSGRSVCPKFPRKIVLPDPFSCPCGKTSSRAPAGNTCSAGTSDTAEQGTTTTEKQQSQHSCKSKSTQDSDTLCNEFTCVHKQPSTRSPTKSRSVESSCNICAVRSKSNTSVKINAVSEVVKKRSPNARLIESTTTTVRKYKEIDGSIVQEMERIIVKGRSYDPSQKNPSKTNSCGSCESGKSTKRVNLCKVPVTKGFIQSVRNIKSETLIRSLDLSTSYPPFLWSSASANTLISLKKFNETKSFEQDPFFCASPPISDDDSVLPLCS